MISRELDGELVLRNAITGNTHLLQPLAAEVLRTLMAAPEGLTTAEVCAHVAGPEESLEDWFPSIEATLLEFQRLGLATASG